MTGPALPDPLPAHWWSAFSHRDFNLFQAARVCSVLGAQMQSIAIGWQIYAITHRPMDLGWVGLAQFLPGVCLSLWTGHVADRFDRRRILTLCYAAMAVLSVALFHLARGSGANVMAIYAVLVGVGVARAFQGPASQSLLPAIVPAEHFSNAVAWSSSFWQGTTVFGPTLGGLAYALFGGATTVYAMSAVASLSACVFVAAMHPLPPRAASEPVTRASLLAGVKYVWSNQIVLGAISLDLFAVLLGGATALLPVYAQDILHVGPLALGALRSAPAVGAVVTGIALAVFPIRHRAGVKMFVCVAVFGAATIVFGVSHSFALSLVALTALGASDMVSVYVRSALVQLATPDAMRGRVSAVNMVFIGASNELGEFESGLTAQWLGAMPAVVVGGAGTLAVVLLFAWWFPKLRRVDELRAS